MLKHLIGLVLPGFFAVLTAQAQLLNLPNGVSDIGTNTSGSGVGIGTNAPTSPIHVYDNYGFIHLDGKQHPHVTQSSTGIRLTHEGSGAFIINRATFPAPGSGSTFMGYTSGKHLNFTPNGHIRFAVRNWAANSYILNGPLAPFRFDDTVAAPKIIIGDIDTVSGTPKNFELPSGFNFAVQRNSYFKGKVQIGDGNGSAMLVLRGLEPHSQAGVLAFEDSRGESHGWFRFTHDTWPNILRLHASDRDNIFTVQRSSGNIGMGADPVTTSNEGVKLFVRSGSTATYIFRGLTGYTNRTAYMKLGRLSDEMSIGIASVVGDVSGDAAVGDVVIRTEDSNKQLIFNNGSGSSSLVVAKDKIGIGIASNIADRLHVHNGITRITGTDAAADISTPGLRLGSHSSNYAWIQSSQAPLALNPNSGTYVAIGFDPLDPNIVLPDPQDNYKLMVKGKMLVEEVKVRLAANWPDYVFAPDYKLAPLEEVESFIQENQHLPQVPSAATVEKEGFELAAMNALLLKKVEELTLYLIEQNKKMEALEKRLERIEE